MHTVEWKYIRVVGDIYSYYILLEKAGWRVHARWHHVHGAHLVYHVAIDSNRETDRRAGHNRLIECTVAWLWSVVPTELYLSLCHASTSPRCAMASYHVDRSNDSCNDTPSSIAKPSNVHGWSKVKHNTSWRVWTKVTGLSRVPARNTT